LASKGYKFISKEKIPISNARSTQDRVIVTEYIKKKNMYLQQQQTAVLGSVHVLATWNKYNSVYQTGMLIANVKRIYFQDK
jgi:hypothetical protein